MWLLENVKLRMWVTYVICSMLLMDSTKQDIILYCLKNLKKPMTKFLVRIYKCGRFDNVPRSSWPVVNTASGPRLSVAL